MQPYSIHLARDEHIPSLAAIELAAAQLLTGYAPEAVLSETTDQCRLADAVREGRLWIASSSGTPVGFALVVMLAPNRPHLEEVGVHPAHGRRGLGAALVRAACEWTAASGYATLTLTTFRHVPWNYPFYSRLGFVEIPRHLLPPELASVVADEAARGLDPRTRVVMSYDPRVCRSSP